jgi:hypothetical protein
MAKRSVAKRERIDTKRGGKRFVRRREDGTFKEGDEIKRSLPRDRGTAAKTRVRSGQGDRGDR